MAPNNKSPPVCVADIDQQPQKKESEKKDTMNQVGIGPVMGVVLTLGNNLYWNQMLSSSIPPDPRQDSWWLMHSQYPTLGLSIAYVLFATWLGPKMMEHRRPVEGLRPFMVAYNAFQVIFCSWLVFELGMGGWFGFYSFRCQPCDLSQDPRSIRMMYATYWYYFSKLIDFLDTVFFVLRKKYNMISFLHVSHHALMPACAWNGVRFQPGGHITLLCILNSFVHVVMYLYYLLAAMGPRVRPFLWWKKYLTSLQMVQFVLIFVHSLQMLWVECPAVAPNVSRLVMGHSTLLLLLFANFYIQAYIKKKNAKERAAQESVNGGVKAALGAPGGLNGALATNGVDGLRPRSAVATRM